MNGCPSPAPYLSVLAHPSNLETSPALLSDPGQQARAREQHFRNIVSSIQAHDLEVAKARLESAVRTPTPGESSPSADSPALENDLLARFVERLRSTPGGEVFPALHIVVERLGAQGACLLELQESREAVILGLSGKVELSMVEDLALLGRVYRRDIFLTEASATGLLSPRAGASLGLVVAGDFPGRKHCEQLFRTLLTLYQCLEPLGSAGTRSPARSTFLVPEPPQG